MYLSNEGHKVEVNTDFYFLVKTNYFGIDDFKISLFDKSKIETKDVDADIEEYVTYDDKQHPQEDYEKGTYTIKIDDVSKFVEKKYARINDYYYKISKVDSDENELTFEKPLQEDITTDDYVYQISYNEMVCLYKIKFTPENVGNYMLIIDSLKYNVSVFEPLDVLPQVTPSETLPNSSIV